MLGIQKERILIETTAIPASLQRIVGTAMGAVSPTRVRIGQYEVDLKAGEVHSGQRRRVLQGQPHKILLMLIERAGEVVMRDEIRLQLWPDGTIVNYEVSINQAVRKVRIALDDSAAEPRFIETVGRRGYRLRVPVIALHQSSAVAPPVDHSLLQVYAGDTGTDFGNGQRVLLVTALLRLLQALASLDRTREQAHGMYSLMD